MDKSIIEQMLIADGQLRACWLGNDGWLFAHGGNMIATDLDLCLPERTLPPFTEWEELARALGVLFVTHAHTDHFNPDTVRRLMALGDCILVLADSCRTSAELYGLDNSRIRYARPGRSPTDEQNNPLLMARVGGHIAGLPDWLQAEAIRALHGHIGGAVYGGANDGDCGYLLRLGGQTIFEPGDSVLLQEHGELGAVDVLLVSPTEHNMGVEAAKRFVQGVGARQVLAQHFGTYREQPGNAFWTHGYQLELAAALGQGTAYRIPTYGQPFVIE